jgi:hypothetical protein
VDKQFWRDQPALWYRLNVTLTSLYSFRDFMEQKLLPAAEDFTAAEPGNRYG